MIYKGKYRFDPKKSCINNSLFKRLKMKNFSVWSPPGAAFFAWSRSRPNLVGTGVGSGTSDFRSRSRPKKVAAPQHCLNTSTYLILSLLSFRNLFLFLSCFPFLVVNNYLYAPGQEELQSPQDRAEGDEGPACQAAGGLHLSQ